MDSEALAHSSGERLPRGFLLFAFKDEAVCQSWKELIAAMTFQPPSWLTVPMAGGGDTGADTTASTAHSGSPSDVALSGVEPVQTAVAVPRVAAAAVPPTVPAGGTGPPTPDPVRVLAVAVESFGAAQGAQERDLTFALGEEIVVTNDRGGAGNSWYQGYLQADAQQRVGDFPSTFVELKPSLEPA
jgi:hypothetical protein